MKFKAFLVLLVFFLFTVNAVPVRITSSQESLAVDSIVRVAWTFLPDEQATVSIPDSEASRCLAVQYYPAPSGQKGRFAVFNFDSTCRVCGAFELKAFLPSQVKTVSKEINLPCQADLLILGHEGFSMPHKGPALQAYIMRAAEEGVTVKLASLYERPLDKFVKPPVSAGAYYLSEEVFSPDDIGEYGEAYALAYDVAIRKIRARVKPKYVLIIGLENAVPFYAYKIQGHNEAIYGSDHIYATATGNPYDERAAISVSRLPLENLREVDKFFLTASRYRTVPLRPGILTTQDPKNPKIELKTRTQILPFYYGTNQCTPASNCFYGPTLCTIQKPEYYVGTKTPVSPADLQAISCNEPGLRGFFSAHQNLLFQTHGGPEVVLGPPVDSSATDENWKGYITLAKSDFFKTQPLAGKLLHFEYCRALQASSPDDSISVIALQKGAVGTLGRTGKSRSIDLVKTGRMGDQLVALKNSNYGDQAIKLSYYGDPLLKVV